jgi:hypothetical protein
MAALQMTYDTCQRLIFRTCSDPTYNIEFGYTMRLDFFDGLNV